MFYIIVSVCFVLFCQYFGKRLTKILFFRFKNEYMAVLFYNITNAKNAPNFFGAFSELSIYELSTVNYLGIHTTANVDNLSANIT
jgi:hypothetical protein